MREEKYEGISITWNNKSVSRSKFLLKKLLRYVRLEKTFSNIRHVFITASACKTLIQTHTSYVYLCVCTSTYVCAVGYTFVFYE